MLPLASSSEAVAVLDRVRQALADVLRDADTPAFTVSFGVADMAEGTLFVDVLGLC